MPQPDVCRDYHRGNPESEAANDSVSSHKNRLCDTILAFLRSNEGATSDEVEASLGIIHQTASARLRELVRDGYAYRSPWTRSTRSGRQAVVVKAYKVRKEQLALWE